MLIVNRKRKIATTSTLLLESLDTLWNTTTNQTDTTARVESAIDRTARAILLERYFYCFQAQVLLPLLLVGGNLFAGLGSRCCAVENAKTEQGLSTPKMREQGFDMVLAFQD